MQRDWSRTIRARNARELAGAAILAAFMLYTRGFTFRNGPLIVAVAWLSWFFLRPARWQAAPADGGVGVRRELIRQGHLLRTAWAWYVLPLVVAGLTSWGSSLWMVRAGFIAFGVALAVVNYRAGQRLIDEGNR
jgi:hypothetical protein